MYNASLHLTMSPIEPRQNKKVSSKFIFHVYAIIKRNGISKDDYFKDCYYTVDATVQPNCSYEDKKQYCSGKHGKYTFFLSLFWYFLLTKYN